VHEVTLETKSGRLERVVLRRYPDNLPHRASDVAREAAVLEALAASDVPAPALVVCDATGDESDVPAVVMTMLPGSVDLTPRDPLLRVQREAEMLPKIHALGIDTREWEPWVQWPDRAPAWSTVPDDWEKAIEIVQHGPPPHERTFIHRDYQHFNLLWSGERLSGIIDWVEASVGSADVDVAHCRMNLAILYSAELAEAFRIAYEAAAGRAMDPWWDLVELMGFGPSWHTFIPQQVGNQLEVDDAGMNGRIDDLLRYALARI
jgi:aminoglycoside phosphotransferase (APT) family kinase protein